MTRLLVAGGVLAQITYPLTSGHAAVVVTVLSVLLLAGAALAHAFSMVRSWAAPVAVLVSAAGIGGLAEVLGVHTGVPFGSYQYTTLLGPMLFGVPLLVPLAWTMLAHPCLLLGRRLAGNRSGTALLGGLALASWDLFLDPQMVDLGAWRWHHPSPGLPGVPGVPLTNYAGWVVTSIIMVAVMDQLLDVAERSPKTVHQPDVAGGQAGLLRPLSAREEATPATVLAWTWLGSTIGNLAFFGRPAVALYGGLAMGALVVPYLTHLRLMLTATTAQAPAGGLRQWFR